MALKNGVRQGRVVRTVSGQWRAMPGGNDGIHGICGNVVSVTYRLQRALVGSNPGLSAKHTSGLTALAAYP